MGFLSRLFARKEPAEAEAAHSPYILPGELGYPGGESAPRPAESPSMPTPVPAPSEQTSPTAAPQDAPAPLAPPPPPPAPIAPEPIAQPAASPAAQPEPEVDRVPSARPAPVMRQDPPPAPIATTDPAPVSQPAPPAAQPAASPTAQPAASPTAQTPRPRAVGHEEIADRAADGAGGAEVARPQVPDGATRIPVEEHPTLHDFEPEDAKPGAAWVILGDGTVAYLPGDQELRQRMRYLADNLLPPGEESEVEESEEEQS